VRPRLALAPLRRALVPSLQGAAVWTVLLVAPIALGVWCALVAADLVGVAMTAPPDPSTPNVLAFRVAGGAGLAAVGYFAQIPHYVSGPYALASLELLRALERHLDVTLPHGDLEEESRQLRQRLDAATAADDTTRQYVEKLESMIDEERQPAGDDLIAEIERFLRGRADGGSA